MGRILDYPYILFAAAVVAQWFAAHVGEFIRTRRPVPKEDQRQDFDIVRTATLTLLALIIGFSFQMAISRYDQRKTYEEAEANAIGTEYVRADLLPAEDAAKLRGLLKNYLRQRILFYTERDQARLAQIETDTARLQSELWSTVLRVGTIQPTPIVALAVSGMNDVLNAQGYTQSAWWNRIPLGAWGLMALIAIAANLMLGYGERGAGKFLLLVLPVVISIAFFLIADIDSPRGGVIRVLPQNLISLYKSMTGQ
jgi:hypothetical protein